MITTIKSIELKKRYQDENGNDDGADDGIMMTCTHHIKGTF